MLSRETSRTHFTSFLFLPYFANLSFGDYANDIIAWIAERTRIARKMEGPVTDMVHKVGQLFSGPGSDGKG